MTTVDEPEDSGADSEQRAVDGAPAENLRVLAAPTIPSFSKIGTVTMEDCLLDINAPTFCSSVSLRERNPPRSASPC